jgi:CO/xanthine dehydrogenase Mo-binding subunit
VLRSPHPHARIRRVDTSRAEALPGAHAVLSSTNCPEVRWYQEQSLLFDTTLRFVGDEVAAVAAETGDIAEDAVRLIEVEYEPCRPADAATTAHARSVPGGTRG